jgi:hypothetical protein
MKLTQILEAVDAASCTSSTSIATTPALVPKAKRRKMIRRPITMGESTLVQFDLSTALMFDATPKSNLLIEAEEDDISAEATERVKRTVDDTNSRVDSAVRQSETSSPTAVSVFGLQDADGHIIKVTVPREDAAEFETQLADLLEDNASGKEVAEIIHILRQDFEILDVEWNEDIEGDEELTEADEDEPADTEPTEDPELTDTPPLDLADDAAAPELEEPAADALSEPSVEDTASTVDLLQSVINLLKQETEARAAAVEVDKAKTAATLASVEHDKLNQEISQHQEIAAMEQEEDEAREEQKNARLVARLAKFRAANNQDEIPQ